MTGETPKMRCPECGHEEWSCASVCPRCGERMLVAQSYVRVLDETRRVVAIRYPGQGIDGTDVEFPVVRV